MQDPSFNQWENKRPEISQTSTVKPIYRSRAENAQAKLAIEERKLIKLAKKAWEKEADLKKEKENLKILESTLENNNNPNRQKKIEKSKKQIVKSQDKLNKAKTEVDSKTKKVEDMEKGIEAYKLKRKEDY
jgi:multidrug resistance efflux pump